MTENQNLMIEKSNDKVECQCTFDNIDINRQHQVDTLINVNNKTSSDKEYIYDDFLQANVSEVCKEYIRLLKRTRKDLMLLLNFSHDVKKIINKLNHFTLIFKKGLKNGLLDYYCSDDVSEIIREIIICTFKYKKNRDSAIDVNTYFLGDKVKRFLKY